MIENLSKEQQLIILGLVLVILSGLGVMTYRHLVPEEVEEISNPFEDSAEKSPEIASTTDEEAIIKENIRIQEEELEIGSLTMEEINIQKNIDQQKGIDLETSSLPTEQISTEPSPEPEVATEEKTADDDEKDQLDPSLSNMDSSDLENVFSINKTDIESNSISDPESISAQELKVPEEETKEKSEEIKQVLEKLESETQDVSKPAGIEEETAEKISENGLANQLASLTNLKDSNKIVEKIEDKLTISIKEILWEIVPPLAEKIIKGEIDKLKSDIEKEYK